MLAFDEVNDVICFTGEFDTKYQSVTNPVCADERMGPRWISRWRTVTSK